MVVASNCHWCLEMVDTYIKLPSLPKPLTDQRRGEHTKGEDRRVKETIQEERIGEDKRGEENRQEERRAVDSSRYQRTGEYRRGEESRG